MATRLISIFALISFISCNNRQPFKPIITTELKKDTAKQDSANSYQALLRAKENASIQKDVNNLGILISKIEFKLKATKEDLKIFDDGIVPWMNIEAPEKQEKRLIGPDEIVIPYKNVILIIDYPLNNPATFTLTARNDGFSRRQLITEISKRYKEVYAEEERTATTKTIPVKQRTKLYNRNETNGVYGIWGHDISDLDLSTIQVFRNKDGRIYLSLDIES